MELKVGQVVCSIAGRDRDRRYVVTTIGPKRALVADGHKRTIAKPKVKNPLHLQALSSIPTTEHPLTDADIRQVLRSTEAEQFHTDEDKGGNS